MSTPSRDSQEKLIKHETPLERASEDLKRKWREAGLTVEDRAPSDTRELVAALPQGRRPSAKRSNGSQPD